MALTLDPDKRYELVEGEIKQMSHPGGEHGRTAGRLHKALHRWIFTFGKDEPGEVVPPIGFKLELPGATRDTVRSPDLVFVRAENLNQLGVGAATFPPDLAVEVISPEDEPADLAKKLDEYQKAGWNLIWVIYPPNAPAKKDQTTVRVYHLQDSNQPSQVLKLANNNVLTGEGSLATFSINLSELFDLPTS